MTSSRSRFSPAHLFRYAFVWILVFVAVVAGAANKTWQSSGGNWNVNFSWTDDIPAMAGDSLNFPEIFTNSAITIFSTNDLTPDTMFGSISVVNNGDDVYFFGGNSIVMGGPISSAASTTAHSWGIPLKVTSPQSFTFGGSVSAAIDNQSAITLAGTAVADMILDAGISGNGSVVVNPTPSPYTVAMQVANTYTGPTTVNGGGTLILGSSGSMVSDVTVLSGGYFNILGTSTGTLTVAGSAEVNCCSGSSGPVTVASGGSFGGDGSAVSLDVNPGGTVAPGSVDPMFPFPSFQTLNTGSLTISGTYEAEATSSVPSLRRQTDAVGQGLFFGANDQINVTGTVTLGGTLDLQLLSPISNNASFNIINNDGADAVNGMFSNFPDGAEVLVNDSRVVVDYQGGDGNDVVVTVVAQALHWTGAGGMNFWGDPSNWLEFDIPQDGDILIFGAGASQLNTFNDLGGSFPLTLDRIEFQVNGYTLDGNGISLANGISMTGGATSATISLSMTLVASQSFQFGGTLDGAMGEVLDLGLNTLTLFPVAPISLQMPIIGSGNLIVDGSLSSSIVLTTVANTFTGTTTVQNGGVLSNNGSIAGATFGTGGRIAGRGDYTGGLTVTGGVLAPGSGDGSFSFDTMTSGNLVLTGTLESELGNPPPPGPSFFPHFDRVAVTGSVQLGGTLAVNATTTLTVGNFYPIVANDGTDPVIGTFAGLPEGAIFSSNGNNLKITYVGGDGNDVVVTVISSPFITSVNPANGPTGGGTAVTLTGNGFMPGATVAIASVPATNVVVVSPTTVTFVTPSVSPSGPAVLVLTNPDGGLATEVFTLDPPSIASISPNSGPVGTVVTITGASLTGVNSVTFNGVAASFTVNSDTQITATVPAGATTGPVVATSGSFSSNGVTFTVACSVPTPTITPNGATSFCGPGSVVLTATTPSTPTVSSYLWSTGETSQSITVSSTGNYTVTVTYSDGCQATSAPQSVTVKSQPTVSISGPTSSCAGGTATLTASGTNISTYLWSPGGETTPSITVPVSSGSSATYSVTVTSVDGCTASASHTISPVSPRVINIDVPASVPSGGTATASAQSGFTGPFTWTVLNGVIVSGQGTSSIEFQAGTGGNVTIFVSSPDGACSADGSAIVPILACATNGPALISPSNNATLTSPVTFSWSPVNGATSYEVYVQQGTSAPLLLGATGGTTLSTTVSSGASSWFVLARLSQSCDPNVVSSETRSFTVTPSVNCPTAGPVALSPSEGARVFSPATFTWSPVTGATGYRVLFSSNGGAFEDLGGILSASTTSIVASVPAGDAVWYVEAIYSGCPAIASSAINFRVDPEDCSKHVAPSLLAPANGSTVASSSVTFRWSAVEGADGYRVWNAVNGGEAEAIDETPETTLTATIEPGSIQWFVEALFEGCESTFSPTLSFTVPLGANCAANQAPQLISPASGIVTSDANVTFSWSSVGAIEYELYLSVNSGTPTLVTRTAATSFMTEVPEGDLEFFVRAKFNGCPATTSASRQFRYQAPAACGTELPVPISPQADTTPIPSPVKFRWSAVDGAQSYILTIASSAGVEVVATTSTELTRTVASGAGSWTVEAVFGLGCSNTKSAPSEFLVVATPSGCVDLEQPQIAAPSQISDDVTYFVQWQPVVGATSYQLQRSVNGSFENVAPQTLTDTQASFTDSNDGSEPLTVLYRVRALTTNCTPLGVSAYSSVVGVTILPAVQNTTVTEGSTLLAQNQTINYSIQLGAEFAGATFSATPTEPWLTVTPSSGTVPAGGITLDVTANTDDLPIGSSAGNVVVSLVTPDAITKNGLRQRSSGNTTKTVPVNVNLVTPVTPNPKSGPPPDALIIPAVAHADGVNAQFQSDVRVTNTSPQVVKYQLTFTPTGDAGISAGRQATIDIEPGRTVALDDVLKTWFGTGTSNALGTLEIRPLTKTAASTSSAAVKGLPNFVTFAASRTFNQTANGTFGQFIPAVPFANFLGRSSDPTKPAVMSLQQIAQSAAFRTNLGLVEGSGQPATVNVAVFGDLGQKLTDFEVQLKGGQHMQLGSVLAQKGLSVNDGRIEVSLTSPGGKVTAYASVLDNRTSDSLLVTPVSLNEVGNTKFVLPGVAELSGGIPWQTDARLFNASDATVNAQLTLQPLNGKEALTANVTLAPREVKQFDRILSTLFGVTNDGGALHIATATNANLIATARTYRPDGTGGSFGQFIAAVTPDEAITVGSRPLQILQVEESVRYRSNIGLAEVTGQAVTVEVTAIPPDAKFSSRIRVPMAANQFRQLNSLLRQMGLNDTHNARVSVRVVEGQGRITAYASVVDNVTADPTFVPAQ